jgi:hypothetical protein
LFRFFVSERRGRVKFFGFKKGKKVTGVPPGVFPGFPGVKTGEKRFFLVFLSFPGGKNGGTGNFLPLTLNPFF